MDSSQEQQIIKKNEELQNDIKFQISELIQYKSSPTTVTKLVSLINQFEPNPKLLDPNLEQYIEALTTLYLSTTSVDIKPSIGEIIYTLAKIRGFKQITLYFSSDLYVIGKLINFTKTLTNEFEIFFCLIWLCNLVLVPFDLREIDEGLSGELYDIAEGILSKYNNGSKNQIIASILLSRLLTRSDCTGLLHKYLQDMDNKSWSNEDSKLGYYLTINKILKRTQLSVSQISSIYQVITHDLLVDSSSSSTPLNAIYSIKILSKLGIYFIKQQDYTTVTEIVNSLINDIMNKMIILEQFDTNIRFSMAKALGSLVKELSYHAENYQIQLIDYFVSQLEIPATPDTSIVELNLNYNELNIAKYHTILLTMGYICLNKSLPERYTTRFLNICHQCLFFKVKRLSIVLGKQIRDSSCFIIWAISRISYNVNFNVILIDLIKSLIFDHDLIIKKCCIAVIQEIIGRYNRELILLPERGEFVISFMNIFNDLSLVEGTISYEVIDLLLDKLDLSWLVPELVKVICQEDEDIPGEYLRKLIDQSDQYEVIPRVKYDIEDIIDALVKHNRYHILYHLPKMPNLDDVFTDFKYHEDKQDMVFGYLTYLTHNTREPTELDWNNLFKIMKLEKYIIEFQSLFTSLVKIPFDSITYHLPNSIVLARCLFNYAHFTPEQLDILIDVLKDNTVNADIRSNLIRNLSDNLPPILTDKLYDLFDDYTITIQGDVGSKIRLAMIQLVKKNMSWYIDDNIVRIKLIRLSGELMDKLRLASFQLLHELTNTPVPDLFENYWYELFNYYGENIEEDEAKVEFWRGVVFTLGSFTGNQQILNTAFDELLRYNPTTQDLQYLLQLLTLPTTNNNSRQLKCINVTLSLFLKLFQANFQFSTQFKFQSRS
ncbi:Tubulin-folding cofactor D [Spathaspora sp. JA1]|nr:Tubulin-folding cofactor D [Spathaspora sp. JA1]